MACISRGESEMIGYFSIDEHRNYVPGSSTLLYYNPLQTASVHLDLNEGAEKVVPYQKSVAYERLDYLLKWITLNRSKIEAPVESGKWIQPDFVCPAGLFSRILSTPFELEDNWVILAAKWKGTIYLYVDKTNYVQTLSEKVNIWGQKFPQFIFSENPCEVPDTSKPVYHSKEFRCLYRRQLGNSLVLFDNVMQGVCSDKRLIDPLPLHDLKFIEAHISRCYGKTETFRKLKLRRWWSRASITNIEAVVCGFRDDDGIIRELKTYKLDQMGEMIQDVCDPSACHRFAETFLTKMKESVVYDCDKTIYRFERIPSIRLRVEQTIMATKLSPSADSSILPAWYMQETET